MSRWAPNLEGLDILVKRLVNIIKIRRNEESIDESRNWMDEWNDFWRQVDYVFHCYINSCTFGFSLQKTSKEIVVEKLYWFSLLPPLLTIIFAIISKKIIHSLLIGLIIGSYFLNRTLAGGFETSIDHLVKTLADKSNLQVLLFL